MATVDNLEPRGAKLEVDLESGEANSEEDRSTELVSARNLLKKKCLKRVLGGNINFDSSVMVEAGCSTDLCSTSSVSEVLNGNLEVLARISREHIQESVPFLDKFAGEKRPTTNSRKSSKPPRPPKGPSLNAADRKFVKDMAEVAMKKRARIDRIKAIRKAKAANASASSSSSSLFAMLITVLFFLIIVLQGIHSRRMSGFQDSPEPALNTGEGFMPFQHHKNLSVKFGRRVRF